MSELAALVRQVPIGRCASYGSLGKAMRNPVSGFLAGKWMARLDERYDAGPEGEVPWWRIVKADGTIATFDRDPTIGLLQKRQLIKEGVPFIDERVDMTHAKWDGFSESENLEFS